MKIATLAVRRATAALLSRRREIPSTILAARSASSTCCWSSRTCTATTTSSRCWMTSYNPQEIERELQAEHEKAKHAFDDSQGDYDVPKTHEQMEELHHIYHRISELETELAQVKALLRDNQRTFAIDAPDGETDGHLQEELEEIKHIIDDAAAAKH